MCCISIVAFCTCAEGGEQSAVASRIEMLKARLENSNAGDVIVVAHRACWRESSENSISAIDACVRLGVDMVEIDVRRTKDGELVLMHDATVNRTTNGTGVVANLTLNKIQQLHLRKAEGGGHSLVTKESIPTLRDALAATKDRILVNLDIKANLYSQALAVADNIGVTNQIVMKMVASVNEPALRQAQFLGRTYFMPIS